MSLNPDSPGAQELGQHIQSLQSKAADAEMRAVLNRAEINRLRLPFACVDDMDWEYLLGPHALGMGGRDQFWRAVLTQMRAALAQTE
jgi:hypothetical protein